MTFDHDLKDTSWNMDQVKEFQSDSEKLLKFVSMYCSAHHNGRKKEDFKFIYEKVPVVLENGPPLCVECENLLRHAITMRVLCPLDPKPKCRKCPQHCYRPHYRDEMEVVMKYAGPRSIFNR